MELRFSVPRFLDEPLYTEAKHSVIVAGRRTGKTYNAVQWILDTLLTTDRQSGLWVDTVHNNIDRYVERYFIPLLKPLGGLCTWNAQKKILKLPNDKYIDFGSAQKPENLEGFQYDCIVMNEAGIILSKPMLWTDTVEPMAKGDKTLVRFIGTPKGKNLFHKLYTRGLSGSDDWQSYHFTAYDSPFWRHSDLDKIKGTTPQKTWASQYMAEFVENEGSVFRNIQACSLHKEETKWDYMAVDLAKTTDYTVIAVGNEESGHCKIVDRFNQIDWGLQKKRIVASWEAHGQPTLRLDATGVGSAIVDDLKNAGIEINEFKFTNTTKNEIIKNLVTAIENADISWDPHEVLESELSIFEYETTISGNIRYNAPQGYHDDTVVTLAMLWDLMREDSFYFAFS